MNGFVGRSWTLRSSCARRRNPRAPRTQKRSGHHRFARVFHRHTRQLPSLRPELTTGDFPRFPTLQTPLAHHHRVEGGHSGDCATATHEPSTLRRFRIPLDTTRGLARPVTRPKCLTPTSLGRDTSAVGSSRLVRRECTGPPNQRSGPSGFEPGTLRCHCAPRIPP